jgi:tetratricopeptide (TPR) repeat protein
MRTLLTPSIVVPGLMIAAMAAMVVTANLGGGRSQERSSTRITPLGAPGGPSTTRDGLAARVSEMEARLSTQPADAGAAVILADALIRQSRVTGSSAPTMRAADVLSRALTQDPDNYDLLHMQSTLLLSQHRFKDAIAVAERCRDLRPADAMNYGVIGDGHLELGDYDEAFDAFERMMQLKPNAASYARVAYARELQGDLKGALASMKLAADASQGGDVEAVAWYRAQVGELQLKLGQPSDAMQSFIGASHAFPGHPYAVIGYAKALEAIGKTDEARALLEDFVKRTPGADVYARLGDMAAKAGQSAAATKHWALAEAMWRSDTPEPKNLARFLAERGQKIDEAVAIAEAASKERHDIFTEDALAWAYFKAGRTAAAREAIARALRTGTQDAEILRHAAAIEHAPVVVAMR